jgi:hypothetical protein
MGAKVNMERSNKTGRGGNEGGREEKKRGRGGGGGGWVGGRRGRGEREWLEEE